MLLNPQNLGTAKLVDAHCRDRLVNECIIIALGSGNSLKAVGVKGQF